MDWLRKFIGLSIGGLIGGILCGAFGYVMTFGGFGMGQGLINQSYNLSITLPWQIRALKGENKVPDDCVIVYLDDESFDKLGIDYLKPVNRSYWAVLMERLKADGAKAVAFDIIFSDPTDVPPPEFLQDIYETADTYFAAAMDSFTTPTNHVILGVDEIPIAQNKDAARGTQWITPIDAFMNVASGLGSVQVDPEDDLVPRRHLIYRDDSQIHSLAWITAEMNEPLKSNDSRTEPGIKWINYYGPSLEIPWVSLWQVFDTEVCPIGFFKDKTVFIGANMQTLTAAERKDAYPTPFSKWFRAQVSDDSLRWQVDETGNQTYSETVLFSPGVEIQATKYLNLIHRDWLKRLLPADESNIALGFGVLVGILLASIRPVPALFTGIVLTGLLGATAYFSITKFLIWFPWVVIAIQILIAMVWSIVFNSINLYVQSQLMSQSLGMYVSPAMVKIIMKRPEILKPGYAVNQELSILFSDIANFTAMSEGMDPDELAQVMNNYFEIAVSDCIQKTEGTVVKYIGDAIFAIWNAPVDQENHQELACRGAILLRDNVRTYFGNMAIKTDKDVRTRIGVHSGDASVGNFGSSRRVDYTAFGENINLASRMEGLNKYVGTDILITGEVEQAVTGKFVTRFLGRFILKGFGKSFKVFELISELDKGHESSEWRTAFGQALDLFHSKQFTEAESAFNAVLEIKPEDGPSLYYLNTLSTMDTTALPETWDGAIELKEK